MIPHEIIIQTSNTFLENFAHIAEIIIASVSIFSIWFSIKSLRKTDWNSNMSTTPSITLNCRGANFWRSDSAQGGGSWGEPTTYLDPSSHYITFALGFSVLNEGRGVALGIKQPKVKCMATSFIKDIEIPVSMGSNNGNPESFEVYITEQHNKWLDLMEKPLDIEVSIDYTNDQGNVSCTSKWTAELKPFNKEDARLVIRDRGEKILNADMKVIYKQR